MRTTTYLTDDILVLHAPRWRTDVLVQSGNFDKSNVVPFRSSEQSTCEHATEPVGAENAVMSCDLHILVYQAAESISSQRPDCSSGRWGVAPVGGC